MRVPTSVSSKFRLILLGCVALQRLIVMIGATLSTLYSPAQSAFDSYRLSLLLGGVAVLLVLLGCVFLARGASVVKWLFLLLVSIAEVAIWIGFDKLLHTNTRLFNCSFSLLWTLILMLFDAIRGRKRTKVHDIHTIKVGGPATAGWVEPQRKKSKSNTCLQSYFERSSDFLAIHKDGPIAFIITVIASCVVYAAYMSKFLSGMDFGLSLLFQFVLMSWFTLDLRRLDRHLNIHEASLGVMYIYIDAAIALGYVTMVLTKLALEAAVVLTIIGIAAALCVGFIMSGPALGGCGNGSCGGWGNCCECKRCSDLWYSHCYSWTCCGYYWSRDDGFTPPLCDDSKCLLYSKHHSDCDCCATFPSEKRTIRRRRRHRQQDLDEVMQRV